VTGHVIHLSTTVNASPDAVWDVLTDLPHAADILRSVRTAELLTEGEYAVGTTWREDRTFFGHKETEELHVTESEPPRRTIHETKVGHDRIRTAYSIQPGSDGRTKLLLTVTIDMSERTQRERLAWATWGNISFEQTKKVLDQDLEDIGREAERREADISGSHAHPGS
jgi:hypothetical protein